MRKDLSKQDKYITEPKKLKFKSRRENSECFLSPCTATLPLSQFHTLATTGWQHVGNLYENQQHMEEEMMK